MILRQFGNVILTKLLLQNGNLLKQDCIDLENCTFPTKVMMLEFFSKFCVVFCNCTPISCPVKLKPNGWKVHLMAHLDCKYLYSSPQLEIAFRNFKWIPLPHELDWYHYSVQFFRVLLFLFLQGVHICFTDCKAANETQKRFVDALNDELWTRQAPRRHRRNSYAIHY